MFPIFISGVKEISKRVPSSKEESTVNLFILFMFAMMCKEGT